MMVKKQESNLPLSKTNSKIELQKSNDKNKEGVAERLGRSDFFIVGIGASAGGLESFEIFFQNMPVDSGMAFILVPHLDPTHTSLMPELIMKKTKMEVFQIKDGDRVKPNTIYIVPPNKLLAILNGKLQLLDFPNIPGLKMPIDFFLRSLAEDQGDKAICLILSGMGTDGTLGLRAIKGNLGMAMVQSVDSAQHVGMPKSAIETQLVDYILNPEKMPKQLIAYVKHVPKKIFYKNALVDGDPPNALQKIIFLIKHQTGHDFSAYKQNTLCRRIERRMIVHQIDNIKNYVRYLQENCAEVEILFKELLIGVTNFFRDDPAFEILQEKALYDLLKNKSPDDSFRVWIPGCSTGEEAYSIAMLLRESTEQFKKNLNIQIFATDIDERAIETARAGIYPASVSTDLKPERLKRFFRSDDNVFTIKKDIREMLIFAPQDIIKDPPFTKLDLICCRNLLIYLESEMQKKLLPLFHYSLKPGGILFLGSSETIGGFTDIYSMLNKKWKIYKRKDTIAANRMGFEFTQRQREDVKTMGGDKKENKYNVARLAEKSLLAHYAPPSVIINDKGDILYIHGRTGCFLEPAPGEARLSIYEMAREGLKYELHSGIRKAAIEKEEVIYKKLSIKSDGVDKSVNLTIRPMIETNIPTGLMLIEFEDITPQRKEKSIPDQGGPKKKRDECIEDLEQELRYTKENLQSTIEELETTNEELKSTNEELQSTNEELQSTNEELETSKEEQQSMNEELTTVNSELQCKIDELSRANDDLENLLNAIEIPTLFLNNDLYIMRFTSHATRLINLIPTDIGRSIDDIACQIVDVNISEISKAVLKDLVYREKEICTKDGNNFIMRVAPYRTTENIIDGVVITFTDLTKEKEIEEREHRLAAEARIVNIIEDSNDAVTLQDLEGNILEWNRGAERMYGFSKAEALQMNMIDMVPKEKQKEVLSFMEKIKLGEDIKSFKTLRITKEGKILNIWLTVTKVTDFESNSIQIATTERDLAWLAD